jgi:hypothetical protein
MLYDDRSTWIGRTRLFFCLLFAVASFEAFYAPAQAQAQNYQGCDCSGYPATAKTLSCFCRGICMKVTCPGQTGAPTFIESKTCPAGPSTPSHDVSRICCTGNKGATRCRPYPSCKKFSES